MMKYKRPGHLDIETIKKDWPLERWLLTEPGILTCFVAINRKLLRSGDLSCSKSCLGMKIFIARRYD